MKLKLFALYTSFLVVLWFFSQSPREHFGQSFGLYALLFLLFVLIYNYLKTSKISFYQLTLMALFVRVIFLFHPPLHSDDYFRFFWDGSLVLNGIDPYEYTPEELVALSLVPEHLAPYYSQLNSPNYYSIYPVTNQVVFAIGAYLGGESINAFVFWVRIILILFELVGIWALYRLLERLNLSAHQVLLYALNPLILLEITGNLHFEGAMLSCLFLGLLALHYKLKGLSGGWMGMAIAIKLTPLIILPFFLKYFTAKEFFVFIISVVGVLVLFFLPITLLGNLDNFISSIRLYYGTFEFNASVYILLRELGYLLKGYNMISVLSSTLSLVVLLSICYLAWKARIKGLKDLIVFSMLAYAIYLLLSMVVHPWYIIPLLGLGILSGFHFPMVWSFLIYLSYYTYSDLLYKENYLLVSLQYLIVIGIAVHECLNKFQIRNKSIKISTKII